MRILIATPLFPPELGEPAEYVWELAQRLATEHSVTLLTYAHAVVPIPNVRIIQIEKQHRLLRRLITYTRALLREVHTTDLIYAQKAGAAGFPAALVSKLRNIPLIVHFPHDEVWERRTSREAHSPISEFSPTQEKGVRHLFLTYAQRFTLRQATHIIVHSDYHAEFFSTQYGIPRTAFCTIPQPLPLGIDLPFPATPLSHRVVVHMPAHTGSLPVCVHHAYTMLVHTIPDVTFTLLHRVAPTTPLELQPYIQHIISPSRAERQHLVRQSGALILVEDTLSHVPLLAEYMRSEVPVLVPETSTAAHICPLPLLHTFEVSHTESLTQLLTRTLTDTLFQQQHAQYVRAHIASTYSWDAHLAEFTTLLTTSV